MSLENVKVGDRVWRGNDENPKRFLDTVGKLTPQFIYLESFGQDGTWYRGSGYPRGRVSYFITGFATPEEITTWEAAQAQKKTDAEAAEARRQREQEERRERALNLYQTFGVMFDSKSCEGDLITIEHRGHRYEIREIEEPNAR